MEPQGSRAEQIVEGTLERVIFANEETGWSVVRLGTEEGGEEIIAVGHLPEIRPGERLRLTGVWVDDKKYGRQFQARICETVLPATATAIEKYLGSGLIPGFGKRMALRLVEHFGAETLDIIEKEPERLREVPGIGAGRQRQIRQALEEQREVKEVMLFLQGHNVATGHALRIWKNYGPEAIRVVREDPYRLARELHGIGFKTADQIAANLGLPPDSPVRARAAVEYLLAQASEQGHVYLPRLQLVAEGQELLSLPPAVLEEAVDALLREGAVVQEGEGLPGEGPPVYLRTFHAAEVGVAEDLRRRLTRPPREEEIDFARALTWFESRERIELAPEQREAIHRALAAKVLVITGGPGTGKTTLVKGIVSILSQMGRTVLLSAPTGRAAKRLTESTGTEAKTVHRLLEFNPHFGGFERNEDRPLEANAVIVDEASMLDLPLASAVVRALPGDCRLVLVGDVDQLPSVGPGNVLGDLIDSGVVPVVRLTAIFRQAEASAIVLNAHRVNRGELPELSSRAGSDFFFIERDEPGAILATLVHVVAERIPRGFGLDPMADIQVLAPMNRGILGVANLNRELRERLNPRGREVVRGGRLLRVGDRVMQVRNNYELEVFNGDLGRIRSIDEEEEAMEVLFEGRRVLYAFADLDELVPAYACSIHKSQGSEYPCVVLPVHSQHYVMLARNLLYTALTRARRLAILIGEKRALATAVSHRRTRRRYTLLARRLKVMPPADPDPPGRWPRPSRP